MERAGPPVRLPRGIYYGWVIVGVSLLTNVAATPLNPLIFSFFVGPISEDTGWARSAIALAFSIRLLAAAVTTPLLGALLDRHGARWLASGSGIAVLLALLALAFFPTLPMLYVAFAVVGAVGLGAPGGSVMTQVPPAKWFIARRGRALAIATVGLPAGAVAMIPVTTFLLDRFGWQAAYGMLGVGIALVIVPFNAVLMRRTPEDHGLLPDGAAPGEDVGGREDRTQPRNRSWTVSEAARTSVFWVALLAFVLSGVAAGIAFDPITVVVASLGWGWAAERLSSRLLGVVAGGGFALSMLPMMLTSGQAFTIFAYALPWGIAAGAWITLNNVLWPEYFGRAALGAIRGVVLPGTLAAAALGPVAYGLLLDAGISARVVWAVSLVLFAAAGLLLFGMRTPSAPDDGTRTTAAAAAARG
jgi:MFS family permease